MSWHHVADAADLPEDGVIGRQVGDRKVAVYRVEGAFFATANTCTHASALLSEGEVVEGYIECPLHFGLFEIRTGKAAGAPVSKDLRVYPVRVEAGRIEIDIGESET